jgi:hypothetical protein
MRRSFTALAATLILSTAFSEDLTVSEAGLAYVFGSLQSAGLIAREQQFDFAKIVDQRYLVQSRVPNDLGTVRR